MGAEARSAKAAERGISLVEATIILAVLSILTAIMAPAIGDYVSDARASQAKKDVETIGTAIAKMLEDVGETFLLQDGNGAAATNPPSRASSNLVKLVVTDGNTPSVGTARSSGTPDWDAAVNDGTVQTLEDHLVTNTPSGLSANRYRTASDMTVVSNNFDPTDGATFNSPNAWRGAYLPGPLGPDPWGRRYAVNVEYLERPLGTPAGQVTDVFVVSAGQNGLIDTRFDTDGATGGGDDLIYVVSGGTR